MVESTNGNKEMKDLLPSTLISELEEDKIIKNDENHASESSIRDSLKKNNTNNSNIIESPNTPKNKSNSSMNIKSSDANIKNLNYDNNNRTAENDVNSKEVNKIFTQTFNNDKDNDRHFHHSYSMKVPNQKNYFNSFNNNILNNNIFNIKVNELKSIENNDSFDKNEKMNDVDNSYVNSIHSINNGNAVHENSIHNNIIHSNSNNSINFTSNINIYKNINNINNINSINNIPTNYPNLCNSFQANSNNLQNINYIRNQYPNNLYANFNNICQVPFEKIPILNRNNDYLSISSDTGNGKFPQAYNNIPIDNSQREHGQKYMPLNNNFQYSKYNENMISSNSPNVDYFNLPYDYINNINQNEKDEFLKLINGLPMPINKYLCTHNGQRLIEKINTNYNKFCFTILINLIEKNIIQIMEHGTGNYCMQDLIGHCDDFQKHIILSKIRQEFVSLSMNKSAIYVMKKLVNCLKNKEDQMTVLRAVRGNVLKMGINVNASYVLDSIITNFNDENMKQDLYKEIIDNLVNLSLTKHGTCLVKSFLSNVKSYEMILKISTIFADNCLEICQNDFGNYCIPHMLENWDSSVCINIINSLISNVYILSTRKFSCNVIEKSLRLLSGENKEKMIRKILDLDKIVYLLKNKYAKYVVQKALNLINYEHKLMAIEKIKEVVKESKTQISEKQKILYFLKDI